MHYVHDIYTKLLCVYVEYHMNCIKSDTLVLFITNIAQNIKIDTTYHLLFLGNAYFAVTRGNLWLQGPLLPIWIYFNPSMDK